MVKQLMGASGFTFVLAAVHMKPCIMIKRIHEHSFRPFVPVLNLHKVPCTVSFLYVHLHSQNPLSGLRNYKFSCWKSCILLAAGNISIPFMFIGHDLSHLGGNWAEQNRSSGTLKAEIKGS